MQQSDEEVQQSEEETKNYLDGEIRDHQNVFLEFDDNKNDESSKLRVEEVSDINLMIAAQENQMRRQQSP